MKLLLKLLIAGVLLMATAFAQELKRGAKPQEPVAESRASTEQIIATGVRRPPAPLVQPKALPHLNPSLGDIARSVRATHAEAPKAKVVVAEDAPPQK